MYLVQWLQQKPVVWLETTVPQTRRSLKLWQRAVGWTGAASGGVPHHQSPHSQTGSWDKTSQNKVTVVHLQNCCPAPSWRRCVGPGRKTVTCGRVRSGWSGWGRCEAWTRRPPVLWVSHSDLQKALQPSSCRKRSIWPTGRPPIPPGRCRHPRETEPGRWRPECCCLEPVGNTKLHVFFTDNHTTSLYEFMMTENSSFVIMNTADPNITVVKKVSLARLFLSNCASVFPYNTV